MTKRRQLYDQGETIIWPRRDNYMTKRKQLYDQGETIIWPRGDNYMTKGKQLEFYPINISNAVSVLVFFHK
jgi:hypothetical protein